MPKLYTRWGDSGETGLLYGGRVSKADPRCEAYGTIDEVVSALGLARSLSEDVRAREVVTQLQVSLFTVGAELATGSEEYNKLQKHFSVVTPDMTKQLEEMIDDLTDYVSMPREFIIPGGSAASAAMDLARAVLRRAERRVVTLKEGGYLHNYEILRYLNRAADLLFILGRYQDRTLPVETTRSRRASRQAGTKDSGT